MTIEGVRQFINDWAVMAAAVLGLILTWGKAADTVKRAVKKLNLYWRMDRVEDKVKTLEEKKGEAT